jgi:ABC-2 type transport system ATP-binding protein
MFLKLLNLEKIKKIVCKNTTYFHKLFKSSLFYCAMVEIIKIENLTKKFGNFTAVEDISFSVKEGEIFSFLGPNGAGKTTTIKMLTTLLSPTSGEMIVNGFNPTQEKNEARHSFGIVFQDPALDDELTAYENMEFHAVLYNVEKQLRKTRIEYLLRFVGLWERRNDKVKVFSGGMKRRLEIARGLVHHPKILFLDEPTIGLDPQTRNFLWKYIKQLNKKEKMTVFLTTHYMEEAEKISDRVAIIDHGKIVAIGTPDELKKKTKSKTLEDAFLKLTGKTIREEEATARDRMRIHSRAWGRK